MIKCTLHMYRVEINYLPEADTVKVDYPPEGDLTTT